MPYYIKVQDRAYGPFAPEKIRSLLQSGGINPESLVSTDKQNWREVVSFPELIGETASSPVSPVSSVDATPGAQPRQSAPVWYLSFDGSTGFGPYRFDDIVAFVRSGRANADSLVWRNGENARSLHSEPEFASLFAAQGPSNPNLSSFSNASFANSAPAASSTAAKLNARYRFYWLGFLAAVVFPLAGFIADVALTCLALSLPLPILTILGTFLGSVALILASISFYTFIYAFWKTLPAHYAPTTPGKAVGLLFIPYFFYYWNFIVFYEGPCSANRALSDFTPSKFPQTHISEFLGLVYAITFIVCPLVAFVVSFPLLNQMRKAGGELSRFTQTAAQQPLTR